MTSINFIGPYKPILCGIADYTNFITRVSPAGRRGVISFNLQDYGTLLTNDKVETSDVWYGIPSRQGYAASSVREGLKTINTNGEAAVLWFQHEFGIWPDNRRFVDMLENLDTPKVVTFHTLHFQSSETPSGLRKEQLSFLRRLLPHVDAITVFSRGVYQAVTSDFPEYRQKVYILKHGIHSYPEIRNLNRQEAKEKLNDFLLYESDLASETKETLHRQRLFLEPDIVLIGQTGFLSPAKGSELLYSVRDRLQQLIPSRTIAALRIGTPRDKIQERYARKLQSTQNDREKFLLEIWLPQEILPLAQRAFDINFYWPNECTQSGVLAHALGAGATVAGRDLEGVGETLKEARELADVDLEHLILKIKDLVLNPELRERLEETALRYATEYSWERQARRHYELAEQIVTPLPIPAPCPPSSIINTVAVSLL